LVVRVVFAEHTPALEPYLFHCSAPGFAKSAFTVQVYVEADVVVDARLTKGMLRVSEISRMSVNIRLYLDIEVPTRMAESGYLVSTPPMLDEFQLSIQIKITHRPFLL
jgi:hypothetical protein